MALTKVDLVPPERRAAVRAQIADLLAGTGLAESTIIDVSTVSGEGIDELRAALHNAAATLDERARSGRFRLAVDRSFTMTGIGTIVTGTVVSGQVAVGDALTVSPSGLTARVRSIHAQNRTAERGCAGERCALNLVGDGITKEAVTRGDVALDPTLHAPTLRLDAWLRVLASEPKTLGQWMPVRFHHGATEVGGRVVPLGDAPLAAGTEGWIQLVLEHPIAAAVGDRFILRDTSARRTIGGGTLVDLRAPARRRRTPERLSQLAALALPDPADALAAYLDGLPGFIDLAVFARDRALGVETIDAIARRLDLVRLLAQGATFALSMKRWTEFRRALTERLAAFHKESPDIQGMGRERLRLRLDPRLPAAAFVAALMRLAKLGDIAIDGAWVRLPSHQARLTAEHEALWVRVRPLLSGTERFRPPRVRDIAGVLRVQETDVRRLLKLASRLGRVDEVAHDHFFLRATVGEMVDIACAVAETQPGGEFSAALLRDRLDNGRKVAIQILEFFDRHGVTFRRGDNRRINPHRVDLFRPSPAPVRATPDALGNTGRESSPVGRPDFKFGKDREPVLGGFDSHSPPPTRPPTGKGLGQKGLARKGQGKGLR